MNSYRSDVRLTPAAKLALDEYLNDLRQEILLRATRSADAYGPEDTVSVRDIVNAAEEVPGSSPRHTRNSRILFILRAYTILGLMVLISGVFLIIFPKLGTLDTQSMVGITLALAGGMLSGMAGALSKFRFGQRAITLARSRFEERIEEGDQLALVHFLRLYTTVELALRAALATHEGESSSHSSLNQLLARANNIDLLTDQETENFRRLTRLRNELVHRPGATADQDLRKAANQLAAIGDQLSRAT